MTKRTTQIYARFRRDGVRATHALSMAKHITAFEDMGDDRVRLRCEAETDSYLDVFGSAEGYINGQGNYVNSDKATEEVLESIERHGNWCLFAEFFNMETKDWEVCDSIGQCAGYADPLCPFQNYYVPDLMASAVEHFENQ